MVGSTDQNGRRVLAEANEGQAVAHFASVVTAIGIVRKTEDAAFVVAPALDSAIVQNGAGAVVVTADAHGIQSTAEFYRGQIIAHFMSFVTAALSIAKTELSGAIVAPALEVAVAEQNAAMGLPNADGRGGLSRTEIDRQIRAISRIRIAESEFTSLVQSPALDAAVVEKGAGMAQTGVDGHGGASSAEIHHGKSVAHFAGIVAAGDIVAQSKVLSGSPALDTGVIENGTGKTRPSRRNGYGRLARSQIDNRQRVAHFASIVAAIAGIADAQFAAVVAAPAFDLTIVEQRAGMCPAHGNARRGASFAEVDRGQTPGADRSILRIADAQRAPFIVAPAGDATVAHASAGKIRAGFDLTKGIWSACDTIAHVSHVAGACARAGCIGAGGIDVAAAIARRAFVDIGAVVAVTGITHVANASAVRAGCIGAAFGARRARRHVANTGAITHARIAFVIRVGVYLDECTDAVLAAAFLGRRASITRRTALVVAANAIGTECGQTLRRRRARHAVVEAAHGSTIACSTETFVIRIRIVLDGPAGAVGALSLFRGRTGNAGTGAGGIATNAVDAIHRRALRVSIASCAIREVCWSGTATRTITLGELAFVVGIGAGADGSASSAGTLAFFGRAAGITSSGAARITTNAVDAEARRALGCECAGSAIGLRGLGLIASATAIAFAGVALIVGVGGIGDASAHAVLSAAFFERRTCLARAGAEIAAANIVDAEGGKALVGGAARRAIVVATVSCAVASAAIAIVVGIPFGADGAANAVRSVAFFNGGAGHAVCYACSVATDAVGAIARSTLSSGNAADSIGL